MRYSGMVPLPLDQAGAQYSQSPINAEGGAVMKSQCGDGVFVLYKSAHNANEAACAIRLIYYWSKADISRRLRRPWNVLARPALPLQAVLSADCTACAAAASNRNPGTGDDRASS